MRKISAFLFAVALTAGAFAIPVRDEGKLGPNCCNHMCPVARASAEQGAKVTAKVSFARVDRAELLS